jgi:hypothetical protein
MDKDSPRQRFDARQRRWALSCLTLCRARTSPHRWLSINNVLSYGRLKVPSKLRVFLWQPAHQSIPRSSARHHWNMPPSPVCTFCLAFEDDYQQLSVGLLMARSVWPLLDEELTEQISVNQCWCKKRFSFLISRYCINKLSKLVRLSGLYGRWEWRQSTKLFFRAPTLTLCSLVTFH